MRQSPAAKYPVPINLEKPLAELTREVTADVERRYLRKALKRSHGNIGRCAKICGLSRRSISDKLALYKLDKEPFRNS